MKQIMVELRLPIRITDTKTDSHYRCPGCSFRRSIRCGGWI
jgi:DNA-directed RNA polymerase subunit RPC12/RpoP